MINRSAYHSFFYMFISKEAQLISVEKRKDGKRWYVFVRYKDWIGETKQHKKEGFEHRADTSTAKS